jgi:hypothetical protein
VFGEWGKEGGVFSSLFTPTIYFITSHLIQIVEWSPALSFYPAAPTDYFPFSRALLNPPAIYNSSSNKTFLNNHFYQV